MEIKRIGSYQEVDEHGYITKLADVSHIQNPWFEPVDMVKRMFLDRWKKAVHSIYIRGSIAKGCAQENVSDLDSFAVFYDEAFKKIDDASWNDWINQVREAVTSQYPYVADFESFRLSLQNATDRTNPESVTIKLESACIYGEDLAGQIEGFKPNGEVAGQTRYYRQHLDVFCHEYSKANDPMKKNWMVWITRRSLRLGMQLVMEKEQRYTNDLYLCYESFVKHYPEKQEDMYHVLELAINPVANREAGDFLKNFGEWLAQEARKCLQVWGIEEIR